MEKDTVVERAKLISITPDAERIMGFCARVSSPKNQDNPDVSKLLAYCARNKHWSVFEMSNMTLEITTRRSVSPQILRHKSSSFQEFCVTGDTKISFDLPGKLKSGKRQHYKLSIEHLYRNWQTEHGKKNIGKMFARCLSMDGKTIINAHIKDVFQTGEKPCFKVTLANKKTINCTANEKFYVKGVGFVTLEDAVGLELIGNTATMSKKVAVATNGALCWQDKDWLQEQINSGKDTNDIAIVAECSPKTVTNWLNKHGLQTQFHMPLNKDDLQWLRDDLDAGKSEKQIAEERGLSKNTISSYRCKIRTRNTKDFNPAQKWTNYNWMKEQKDSGKNVTEIAEAAGCSYHTIRKWLSVHELSFTNKEVGKIKTPWNKGKFGYSINLKHGKNHHDSIRNSHTGSKSNLWKGGVPRSLRQRAWDFTTKVAREIHEQNGYKCTDCGNVGGKLHVHHIKPVYSHPEFAFDKDNLTTLCKDCHHKLHKINGDTKIWSSRKAKGNHLIPVYALIEKVEYIGMQMTYDLEMNHDTHNYVANGIIVHNSQRYGEVQVIEYPHQRRQDTKNRQSSHDDLSQEDLDWFDGEWTKLRDASLNLYNECLARGFAKETARDVLPLASQTKLYMNGTIRSWIHYIQVRCDPSTQLEHREIAEACKKIFCEQLPITAKALDWL